MTWRAPETVTAPKKSWRLVAVVEEGESGGPAYAVGEWDGEGGGSAFAGTARQTSRKATPISSGHPTWTMLDQRLHEAVIALLAPKQKAIAQQYFAGEEAGGSSKAH